VASATTMLKAHQDLLHMVSAEIRPVSLQDASVVA